MGTATLAQHMSTTTLWENIVSFWILCQICKWRGERMGKDDSSIKLQIVVLYLSELCWRTDGVWDVSCFAAEHICCVKTPLKTWDQKYGLSPKTYDLTSIACRSNLSVFGLHTFGITATEQAAIVFSGKKCTKCTWKCTHRCLHAGIEMLPCQAQPAKHNRLHAGIEIQARSDEKVYLRERKTYRSFPLPKFAQISSLRLQDFRLNYLNNIILLGMTRKAGPMFSLE